MKKTFSVISLGCFRNTYDSEITIKNFIDKGYKFKEKADRVHTLIINTCGFIKEAKEESIEYIRKAIELKRRSIIKRIIVKGCLSQRCQKLLKSAFALVDEWRGVEHFPQSILFPAKIMLPHAGFLKISEGCSNNCSYCAIPLIKGKLVSKSISGILKELKYMDRHGVKEVNIIGQDVTSWGKDLGGRENLASLLKVMLKETKNIRWFRIIYTHPKFFTGDLIDLIAREERICKYIDLPIQHINDRILKMMNRGITKKEIVSLIRRIRSRIKNVAIRTSLIVGFPSESDREFSELFDFVKEIRFHRLGVFKYSREEGTAAYSFSGHVHYRIKQKRFNEIMNLQKSISYEYNRAMLGKRIKVLIDEEKDGVFIGRDEHNAYSIDGVVYVERENVNRGSFYNLKVKEALDYDLVAQ
ncbi:MAG: hypothetical protein B1H08_02600 [Candidatus Omnitrophica bacterium 4484_171]|nr:MAG: hypothetical protein B1H08_02600 [Candidatus Omnitrophica bacterium 4484_171]